MVIAVKHQYEQQCNAHSLKEMRVHTIKKLIKRQVPKIIEWIHYSNIIDLNYPDITEDILLPYCNSPIGPTILL